MQEVYRNSKRSARITPIYTLVTGLAILISAHHAQALFKVDDAGNPSTNGPVAAKGGKIAGVAPTPALTNLTWLGEQIRTRLARPEAERAARAEARKTVQTKLEKNAGGNLKIAFRKNGTPSHIRGGMLERRFAGAVNRPSELPEATAREFLRQNRELLLLNKPDAEMRLTKNEPDALGDQHLRFEQMHRGLRVWPCELIVHLDNGGNVSSMSGAFIGTPQTVATTPSLTADEALQFARDHLAKGLQTENTDPELIIFGPLEGEPRLAWKFNLTASPAQSWECVVDASNGTVLAAYSLVCDAAVTGSGVDSLGIARTLKLWQEGSTYFMVDTSKAMFNPSSTPPNNAVGAIVILDSHNNPNSPGFDQSSLNSATHNTSSSLNSGWLPDAVSAAYGLGQVYDYYLQRHNRNSYDGNGGSMIGFVRVGVNYPNAFFTSSGNFMAYGDGFTRALDVTGHELTHGVIFSTGNGGVLNYHDQPGALNESFADIFGENVEARTKGTNDWLSGAELINGPGRSLINPGSIQFAPGRPFPSKMSEFVQLPSDTDQGGVHINSSIINHCYYLLAAGLNGAIGITNAERIFYRAVTLHLEKESQFIDARHACIASAEEIYGVGSSQALKTAEAFDAVEIFDAPNSSDPAPVPVVSAPDSTLFLRFKPSAGQHELWRREAGVDGNNGSFVPTVKNLTANRVSVAGNGSFCAFVTADHDYGFVNTDGTSPVVANVPNTIHSLAMTPDGKKFAFVFQSFGQPTSDVGIYDLATSTTKTIHLYAPDSEGHPQNTVRYADIMDFTSDGKTLIYDAYSESVTAGGAILRGWTLYSLDLATTNITALYNVNPNFDFGNPAVGKTKNNLVTFEVIAKQTGISTVVALDLSSGNFGIIGQFALSGGTAVPDYTGDDRAIVYSQTDNANSGSSLVFQPVGADGITTNAAPVWYLFDADRVSMYRRGSFVGSNSLPSIVVNSPTNNQVFERPSIVVIQTVPSDPGGSISKVEFYDGSTKIGERTNSLYNFSWLNAPAGKHQITARAIDNLGASKDSAPINVIIANRPQLSNPKRLSASQFQFTLSGDVGFSYDIQNSTNLTTWNTFTTVSNATGSVTVQDSSTSGQMRRYYRAKLH